MTALYNRWLQNYKVVEVEGLKYSSKQWVTVAHSKHLFVLYNLMVCKVALVDSGDHGAVTLPFKTAGYGDGTSWSRDYLTILSKWLWRRWQTGFSVQSSAYSRLLHCTALQEVWGGGPTTNPAHGVGVILCGQHEEHSTWQLHDAHIEPRVHSRWRIYEGKTHEW